MAQSRRAEEKLHFFFFFTLCSGKGSPAEPHHKNIAPRFFLLLLLSISNTPEHCRDFILVEPSSESEVQRVNMKRGRRTVPRGSPGLPTTMSDRQAAGDPGDKTILSRRRSWRRQLSWLPDYSALIEISWMIGEKYLHGHNHSESITKGTNCFIASDLSFIKTWWTRCFS